MKADLTKKLYDKCVSLGVEGFWVNIEGGSDENYVNVRLETGKTPYTKAHEELEDELTGWVWDEWDLGSGAGDGSPYGEDFHYQLLNKKVVSSEWWTERQDSAGVEEDLAFADQEVEQE